MMRVLINAVNDNTLPRGPDRYLLELLPHLIAQDDLSIDLAYAPWQTAFLELKPSVRLHLHCVKPPRRPAPRLLWQATVFPRFANRIAPDVTLLPNSLWTPGLRSPCIMVGHDFLQFRTPEKFGKTKAALLRWVIRRAVARADRVIAVSEFTARDAVMFAGARADQVVTIYQGGPEPEPQAIHQQREKKFLFVAKLERSKGADTLIRAFRASSRLRESGFSLHIIGPDGNASSDLQTLLAKDPRGICRHGFVSDDALREAYRTCRGFVFPSVAEGFGLVLLEAMARGAPVIAARATSLPEVVGNAGLLVSPGDTRGLTEAMERLAFDDALFRKLQAEGFVRLADFRWAETGARTARLLREVAA
ncbi:glycosyltransferase family 4 protein [Roseovarius sp. S4756]|uniref:glycosyltransferase family 4 protein n=1 Tax=Roseovarius maritimus TaxID=3342637 RepID=UPI00372CCB29